MIQQRIAHPAAEIHALRRLNFGPNATIVEQVRRCEIPDWIDEQIHPRDDQDAATNQRLANLKPRVKYAESKDWAAADEMRPLQWLEASPELWSLIDPARPAAGQEKVRPRLEVATVTLARAVYNRWRLKELLIDFWHNHFSANTWGQAVGIALPLYDRAVIHGHCLGNLRQMMEAVAKTERLHECRCRGRLE